MSFKITRQRTASDSALRKEVEDLAKGITPPTTPLSIPNSTLDDSNASDILEVTIVAQEEAAMPSPTTGIPNNLTLKDALKIVPDFDGENITLSEFLESLEEAKLMVDTEAEPNLVKLLRSKLKGEAKRATFGHTFTTIQELKNHLKDLYFSGQTVLQLTGTLGNVFQKPGETVVSYTNRVRDIGSRLIEAFQIEKKPTPEELTQFKTETNRDLALCFKRGLKPEIEHRIGSHETLADARKEAVKIERNLNTMSELRDKFERTQVRDRPERRRMFATEVTEESDMKDLAEDQEQEEETAKLLTFNDQQKCRLCLQKSHITKLCPLTLCHRCPDKPEHPIYDCFKSEKGEHLSDRQKPTSRSRPMYVQTTQVEEAKTPTSTLACQLCDMTNHTAKNCFKYFPHKKGNLQDSMGKSCGVCGKRGHEAPSCWQAKRCNYCGLSNHVEANCFKKARQEKSKNEKAASNKGGSRQQWD